MGIQGDFCCRICGSGESDGYYAAREMMFGLGTNFRYAQCASCGTLWLTNPPEDMAAYYPDGYYSFERDGGGVFGRVKNYLRAERDKTYFGRGGIVGKVVAAQCIDGALLSIAQLQVDRTARILDVGCGGGKLLQRMAALGFKNLTGLDPFIEEEIDNRKGLRIRKCGLEDLGEKYDLVMFHHSLEHVAHPVAMLGAASRLLAAGGKCLVRLPVVAYAWEKYRTNWVQLDPPRHIWVPTEKAIRILAESAGFRAEVVAYDSTGFQFWGSELYARGIALKVSNPFTLAREFGLRNLLRFRKQSTELNIGRMGDQGAFLLQTAV